MTSPGVVSIIIVNYNAGDLLRRCLTHIMAQTYRAWKVIIVDNASQDDSLAQVEGLEQVTIVRNQRNLGFAVAQNQGLHAARGAYLMPLNFDIRMTPDFLAELVAALNADPKVGSACGKLLRMTQDWEPTQEIDSTGLIMNRSLAPASRGHGEVDRGQFDHLTQAFGAQGAAPLYRREMLEDIAFEGQYFDERFFMWYEDVDLDWRAYLRGWQCRFVPTAVAYHLGHPDVKRQTAFHVRTTVRNRWLMLLTNLAGAELRSCWTSWLRYEIGQLYYVVRIGQLPAYLGAVRELLVHRDYIVRKRRWVRSRAVRALWSFAS
jgi:GT2 family glycosyltransferase